MRMKEGKSQLGEERELPYLCSQLNAHLATLGNAIQRNTTAHLTQSIQTKAPPRSNPSRPAFPVTPKPGRTWSPRLPEGFYVLHQIHRTERRRTTDRSIALRWPSSCRSDPLPPTISRLTCRIGIRRGHWMDWPTRAYLGVRSLKGG